MKNKNTAKEKVQKDGDFFFVPNIKEDIKREAGQPSFKEALEKVIHKSKKKKI